MANLLFYKKPVALNKLVHKESKIAPLNGDYSFASTTNSVILAGVEFAEAAKEYPIVFAETGNNKTVPVILLGLRNEENLFVGEDGNWDARYIPAFVRRYPFVLAEVEGNPDPMVCVDEDYAGFEAKEGEALFDEAGENSPMLNTAIQFLSEYQQQYKRTEVCLDRLKEMDLLMTLSAKVNMRSGEEFALTGLLVVDEKKLLTLPEDKAMELFKSGELAWVYSHLLSLSNLSRLVDKIPAAAEAAPEEKKPASKKSKKKAKADA